MYSNIFREKLFDEFYFYFPFVTNVLLDDICGKMI
jgi:hypothetical protein